MDRDAIIGGFLYSLFSGRKGHGGGPCTKRVLRHKDLKKILEDAYDRGFRDGSALAQKR